MKNVINLCGEWRAERTAGGIRYVFPAPEGAGVRPLGFDRVNDAAVDVMRWYGFRFRLATEKQDVRVGILAGFAGGRKLRAEFTLAEAGEHDCDVRLEDFEIERAQSNIWRELVSLEITGNVRIVRGEILRGRSIAVETGVLGKSGEEGETVRYRVTVHSCLDRRQWVSAAQAVEGWESLYARVQPEGFVLEPYGSCEVEAEVQIHDYMPAGAHEKTILRFVPEGDSAGGVEVSLWTLRALAHPYIYHTKEKWRERAELIQKEAVFGPGYEKLRRDGDGWEVPPPVPFGERDYCYDTAQEHFVMSCAYLYCITGRRRYAEKIAEFFRYFADEDTGYPARKKGCSQSYVQEGHFFQHLALAYDMIYGAGVLTAEEHRGIERCFRIYMEILDRHLCCGHISNWTLSELTGAVYCAMALQDFERMERFLSGPCGSFEQLSHGAFADGWWYECSVGYNIWVASMFLHTAHALLPFGINLLSYQFPISWGKEIDSIYKGQIRQIRHGMYNEKWGGIHKAYICIKDLFDAVIPFLDERGVLFGINDSDEKKIQGVHFGSTFDLAYTHYGDPAYIPVIRRFDTVDPVFGHAQLPAGGGENLRTGEAGSARRKEKGGNTAGEETWTGGNACADNIGIAMLRSRTRGRRPGEQIQAVLRYGSHGYAHGHYDRTELLSVMRYGRSFYNPEHVWWGYGHFMYKFYVQNSNTKNMVVVDGKMQLPTDARRVLFYSGERLQAAGVRTVSRWGFPPFGGMIYREGETLEERCAYNACDLPSCDAAPYGEITELTEPIAQTRVMAVLDDCIVLFDSLRGETEHRYESLMQIKGFLDLEPAGACQGGGAVSSPQASGGGAVSSPQAPGGAAQSGLRGEGSVRPAGHTGQKFRDPRSDEQFITDCFWYEAEGETAARFETKYGAGEDLRGTRSSYNEEGSLCMDVYTAWPRRSRQCVGLAAEDLGQRAPYDLKVWEDGTCVEAFSANAWLLGARRLDAALNPNSHTLRLELYEKPLYSEQMYPHDAPQCLFLGDAFLELEDGERISLHTLPVTRHNVDAGMGIGRDYQGGRVLIEGEEYPDAIPVSPLDHRQSGVLEYDLGPLRAVRLTGVIGADNFPGGEAQRRRTYGVAQRGVDGRFITVIEPHDGKAGAFLGKDGATEKASPESGSGEGNSFAGTGKVLSVEGLSENQVRIRFRNGSWQEVSVEGIDDAPEVVLRSFQGGVCVGEERCAHPETGTARR